MAFITINNGHFKIPLEDQSQQKGSGQDHSLQSFIIWALFLIQALCSRLGCLQKYIDYVYSRALDDIVLLFKISSIGPYKIPFITRPSEKEKDLMYNPSNIFVSINTNHSKRAHSNSYVNKNRQMIWKVINEMPLQNPKDNFISVYFQRAATYASPADLEEQFRQCIQKYLRKEGPKQDFKSNYREFFSLLFPFNAHKWEGWKAAKRRFQSIHGPLGSDAFTIFLCHHYKIRSSLRLQELADDLKDFRQMLDKFDFFTLFEQIFSSNFKQNTARSRKLVRILKWRTTETQEYLVFLINEFGSQSIKQALQLFENVYRTKPRSALPSQRP